MKRIVLIILILVNLYILGLVILKHMETKNRKFHGGSTDQVSTTTTTPSGTPTPTPKVNNILELEVTGVPLHYII